jgi:hypothetical protein
MAKEDIKNHVADADGLTPQERAEIYGELQKTPGTREIGESYLYRPEHYICERVGKEERCFTLNPKTKERAYSSPIITGNPVAIIDRDHDKYGEYGQLVIQLTKKTCLKVGEGDNATSVVLYPGDAVLITITEQMTRTVTLVNLLKDGMMATVSMRPIMKAPLPSGNSIWRWNVREDFVRTKLDGINQLNPSDKDLPKELQS